MSVLNGIESSASALNAERVRLDIIAQNIANANSTSGPDGRPYQRREVMFQTILNEKSGLPGMNAPMQSVEVSGIVTDPTPPRDVYMPGHPDADAQGMVKFPNINVHTEMADMLTASRAYEANLSVIKNAESMAREAMTIGR
ncbi:MAG: flagellar basal body rod protein FlgC [Verrucomicrobia bacterium]|nr:flagellar basal body rod protein FlgC [Verrucomicrobiota bacterium]